MTSPLGTRGVRAPHFAQIGLDRDDGRVGGNETDAAIAAAHGRLEELIAEIEPVRESDDFASAVLATRRAAEAAAWYSISLSNHLEWLKENGFSREDARQIRYLVEVHHRDEPSQALFAAVALRLTNRAKPLWTKSAVPQLVADWPAYQTKVADDVSTSVLTGEYERAVRTVCDQAWDHAGTIPVSVPRDEDPELTQVLADCLQSSCEVIVMACALRRMFIRAETVARRMP